MRTSRFIQDFSGFHAPIFYAGPAIVSFNEDLKISHDFSTTGSHTQTIRTVYDCWQQHTEF